MPKIFITPKPYHGTIPQVLKDQAKANEADKAHCARHNRN